MDKVEQVRMCFLSESERVDFVVATVNITSIWLKIFSENIKTEFSGKIYWIYQLERGSAELTEVHNYSQLDP